MVKALCRRKFQKAEIPYHLHEFIGEITRNIEDNIKKAISNRNILPAEFTSPFNINILYKNPRVNGMFYFMPFKRVADIGGSENEYFEALVQIVRDNPALMPPENELDRLIDFAMYSQHTVTALQIISEEVIKGKVLNEYLYTDNMRISQRLLLKKLFAIFVTLDKKHIEELNAKKLLVPVIHTLLGILPQFDDACGTIMDVSPPENAPNEHPAVCLIEWIDADKKINKWRECAGKEKYSLTTQFFFLLSIIESLQWHKGSVLGVINNLYDFLANSPNLLSLELRNLPLSSLSIYFNCNEYAESDVHFEINLKDILHQQIDLFIELVLAYIVATYRRDLEFYDQLQNNPAEATTQGLLNILSPKEAIISKIIDHEMIGHLKLARRDAQELRDKSPIDFFYSPWGIYREDNVEGVRESYPANSPKFECRRGEFRMNDASPDSSILLKWDLNCKELDALLTTNIFMGDLLSHLRLWPWQINLYYDREWYLKAFGEYYFRFDADRHDNATEFKSRRKQEAQFYHDILQGYAGGDHDLKVIDIGIGYGRLAKKLIDLPDFKIDITGLDISLKMAVLAEKELASYDRRRIIIGEMRDVDRLVDNESFNVALLAFSTFGCYEDDEDNEHTLKAIYNILKPGGVLIVEQFNPNCQGDIAPYTKTLDDIDNQAITLLKTTEFLKPKPDIGHTLYTGDYLYFLHTLRGRQLIRRDHYCLRLYREDWLRETLVKTGYDPEKIYFYSDFDTETTYTDNPDKPLVMICVAQKKILTEDVTHVDDKQVKQTHERVNDLIVNIFKHLSTVRSHLPDINEKVKIDDKEIAYMEEQNSSKYKKLYNVLMNNLEYDKLEVLLNDAIQIGPKDKQLYIQKLKAVKTCLGEIHGS
jgi:SAM-dependent methyltransferase